MAYLVPRKTERALIFLRVKKRDEISWSKTKGSVCLDEGGLSLHREVPCFFSHLMDFASGLGSAGTCIVDYTIGVVISRSACLLRTSSILQLYQASMSLSRPGPDLHV